MRVFKQIDPITKKHNGKYLKEVVVDGKQILVPIPVKKFCVCDSSGNIIAVHEIKYSKLIEEHGAPHCFSLEPGHECHEFTDWPDDAPKEEGKVLQWIADNHKLDYKDKHGKRKLVKRG